MKTYPSKLLLFGEHTVNIGSTALAIPLPLFSGHWDYLPDASKTILKKKQMQLPMFAEYLQNMVQKNTLELPIDVSAFKKGLQEGLIFESDIPMGYGAGSSGTIVAAVADQWGIADEGPFYKSLAQLKIGLSQMECFFHGTSSGTDPLVCYLQQPILLRKAELIRQVEIKVEKLGLFLIDTGIQRKATPYIEYFLAKMEGNDFAERCEDELIPLVETAIEASMAINKGQLFDAVHGISEFQIKHLEKMIPEPFKQIWHKGIEGDLFRLKICGAGGGGFILGITTDFEKLTALLPSYKLIKLKATNENRPILKQYGPIL